ncbi:UNVERIFIED_CONTAM: hypothetical protein Cloal_0606 [Acetivibrio alkalicellulosi]
MHIWGINIYSGGLPCSTTIKRKVKPMLGFKSFDGGNVVGLIFPVYYFGIPEIVRRFIEKINLEKSSYVFAVATYGKGLPGGGLSQTKKMLKAKGKELSAGFYVKTVDNFVIWTWDVTPEKKHKSLHEKAEIKAKKIADIESKKSIKYDRSLMEYIGPVIFNYRGFLKKVKSGDKKFYSTKDCVSCALCEKVCQVKNIKMSQGKPEWLSKTCQRCLACYHLCPQNAVHFGEVKRSRYKNPYINIKELTNGN